MDCTVKHMEDKDNNLGVTFDSCLSFEPHIKSLCFRLNGTLFYLNKVKNTLDQKSTILLINALIFSHINYCSSVCGKCSEKLRYEVQKCTYRAPIGHLTIQSTHRTFNHPEHSSDVQLSKKAVKKSIRSH